MGQCLTYGLLWGVQQAVGQFNMVCSAPKETAAEPGERPGIDLHMRVEFREEIGMPRERASRCTCSKSMSNGCKISPPF